MRVKNLFENREIIILLILATACLTIYGGISHRVMYKDHYFWKGELVYKEMSEGVPRDDWRYSSRVMTPFLAGLLPIEALYSFFLVNYVFTYLSSIVFYYYLKENGFSMNVSFIGTLLFLSNYVVASYFGMISVDAASSFFWVLGFYLLKKRKHLLFSIVLFASLFNRETTILLVPLFFFQTLNLIKTTIIGGIGTSILLLLRSLEERQEGMLTDISIIPKVIGMHIERWYNLAILVPAIFGIMWVLAVYNYRKANRFIKRSFFLLPIILLQNLIADSAVVPSFYSWPIVISLTLYSFKEEDNGRSIKKGRS